jgi:fucose permease
LLPVGFAAFLAFGVVLVLVGANQADLAQALGMDLSRSGLLAAAVLLGAGTGVTVAGPLADRFAQRPLFVGGLLVAALALLTLSRSATFWHAFAHLALLGAGAGFYDTVLNVAVIQKRGLHAAKPLAFLHAGATAGAVVGPPLIGWLSRLGDWSSSFRVTGVTFALLALWASFVPLPSPPRRAAGHAGGRVLTLPLLALAVVAFAYVGVETAVTLFAVPWAQTLLLLPSARGQTAISAFWLGLLGGRLAMLGFGRTLGTRFLASAGVGGASILAVALGARIAQLELVTLACGLALGAVYPVMIALAGAEFPFASGTAAGLVAGAGALGGFAIPWMAGALGDTLGLAAGLSTSSLWCLVITAAALALAQLSRATEAAIGP